MYLSQAEIDDESEPPAEEFSYLAEESSRLKPV